VSAVASAKRQRKSENERTGYQRNILHLLLLPEVSAERILAVAISSVRARDQFTRNRK